MTNFRGPRPPAPARIERARNARARADLGISPNPRVPWYSRVCALRLDQGCYGKRSYDKCDLECHYLRPVDLKGTLGCGVGAMRDVSGRPL